MNFIGSICEALSKRAMTVCAGSWKAAPVGKGLWLAALDLEDSCALGDVPDDGTRMAVPAGLLSRGEGDFSHIDGGYASRAYCCAQELFANDRLLAHVDWMGGIVRQILGSQLYCKIRGS